MTIDKIDIEGVLTPRDEIKIATIQQIDQRRLSKLSDIKRTLLSEMLDSINKAIECAASYGESLVMYDM